MPIRPDSDIWFASGVRTPFTKVDGALSQLDAIALSVPVAQAMVQGLTGAAPDFAVWGTVVPNLTWSNVAREVLMDAGLPPSNPGIRHHHGLLTSMVGAIQAAGMLDGASRQLALVGGVESMSRVQIGLGVRLSDWVRKFPASALPGTEGAAPGRPAARRCAPVHSRRDQPHQRHEHGRAHRDHRQGVGHSARAAGPARPARPPTRHRRLGARFLRRPGHPVGDAARDTIPRKDTSLEKLAKLPPAFDRTSGQGTLTAGNSSPLTDGAAALWVASTAGLDRLPSSTPRVRLVDWEIASVDFRVEGLLMAPAFAIPRLLARHDLRYEDIALWEIHEAFGGQVLFHIKALEDRTFLQQKAGVERDFGAFPARAPEPQRRQRGPGPSLCRHGRAHPQPGGERTGSHASGHAGHRQHLRRWRPGQCGAAAELMVTGRHKARKPRRPNRQRRAAWRSNAACWDTAGAADAGAASTVAAPGSACRWPGRARRQT